MSDNQGIRLNKYLAAAGVCSRREADRLIEQGRVCVNDRKAKVGDVALPGDVVSVNGKVLIGAQQKQVYAFYKPVGLTCTERDPFAKRTVKAYVDETLRPDVRLTYAGRLDRDSEGLLLLTNDGDLIHALMRSANRHEKEYIVKVNKEVTVDFVKRMSKGVYLKELEQMTRACAVEKIGRYTFRIVLTQGLNRQIRRMCSAFGYQTVSLKRVRINGILLGSLTPGQLRRITGEELQKLYESVGM
ncbi:MAG: pseudouridine synthase [Lachnospiraceae bacterium]|nr:pseudouridine synthase [Lachnospiraceae bacterium]